MDTNMKQITVKDRTGKHLVLEMALNLKDFDMDFTKYFKASFVIFMGRLITQEVDWVWDREMKWLIEILESKKSVLQLIEETKWEIVEHFDIDFQLEITDYEMPNTVEWLMAQLWE